MAGLDSDERPGRHTAGIRDTSDNPIERDEYAVELEKELDRPDRQDRISIKAADAYVAAELLDELAAIYKGEHLGLIARSMAVRLYDRLGI